MKVLVEFDTNSPAFRQDIGGNVRLVNQQVEAIVLQFANVLNTTDVVWLHDRHQQRIGTCKVDSR